MSTTLTASSLGNADIEKLKREFEVAAYTVESIIPNNPVQVILAGTVSGGSLTAANAILNAHVDNRNIGRRSTFAPGGSHAFGASTADGADNEALYLTGGGATTTNPETRGGVIIISGNENGLAGRVDIQSGNIAGANINILTRNASGIVTFGTNAITRASVDASGNLFTDPTNGGYIGVKTTPSDPIHAAFTLGNETTGLRLDNNQLGGYGSALKYYSKQNFGGNTLVEAVRVAAAGEANYTSAPNTVSGLTFWTINAGTLAEKWRITGIGNLLQDATNGKGLIMPRALSTQDAGILLGASTRPADIAQAALVCISDVNTNIQAVFQQSTNDVNGVYVYFQKTRKTDNTADTIIASGDNITKLVFRGADGATFRDAAAIMAYSDGTPGVGDMPGRLEFYTTPDGSATLSRAFYIDSAQRFVQDSSTGGDMIFTRTNPAIMQGTVDGSDSNALSLSGGGGVATSRGANIIMHGNEHANTGQLRLFAGNVTGGRIFIGTIQNGVTFCDGSFNAQWSFRSGGTLEQDGTSGSDIIFGLTDGIIRQNTSDTTDNKSITIAGGGGTSNSRGAKVSVYGNEYTTTGGGVSIVGGATTTGHIILQTQNSTALIDFQANALSRWTINSSGTFNQDGTNGGDVVFNKAVGVIRQGTADASDNGAIQINGGGANGPSRGASITVTGNESGGTGSIELMCGSVNTTAHCDVRLQGTSTAFRIRNNTATLWSHFIDGTIVQDGTSGSDIVFNVSGTGLRMGTSDGTDNKILMLSGGGGVNSTNRGALINLNGNEAASPGKLELFAGNVSGGDIQFGTLGANKWKIPYSSNSTLYFQTSASYILAETSDGSDTYILNVCGGGNSTASRGAVLALAGNEASGGGSVNLNGGNVSSGIINLNLNHASASIQLNNSSTAAMWNFDNSGNITQNATNGNNLVFAKAGSGVVRPVSTGLSGTGTVQAGATSITNVYNELTTVTVGSADAFVLASTIPVGFSEIRIVNRTANAAKIFPHSGGTIDSLGLNAAFTLLGNTSITFYKYATNQYYSDATELNYPARLAIGNTFAGSTSQVALASSDYLVLGPGGASPSGTVRTAIVFNNNGWSAPASVGSLADGDKIVFYNQSANTKSAIGIDSTSGMWFQTVGNVVAKFRWYLNNAGAGNLNMALDTVGRLALGSDHAVATSQTALTTGDYIVLGVTGTATSSNKTSIIFNNQGWGAPSAVNTTSVADKIVFFNSASFKTAIALGSDGEMLLCSAGATATNGISFYNGANETFRVNRNGELVFIATTNNTIRTNTSDGSDNQKLTLCGGGAASATRGSYIELNGNETGSGHLNLVTSAGVNFYFGGQVLFNSSGDVFLITNNGEMIFATSAGGTIKTNSSDGADNKAMTLTGGGGPTSDRGARVITYGNEYTAVGGRLLLEAGDISTADIYMNTHNLTRWIVQYGGDLVNDSSNGGNIVFQKTQTAVVDSVEAAITATGTTVTDAYQLTKVINYVTAGAANTGVKFWTAPIGMAITVASGNANNIKIYVPSGHNINGVGGSFTMSQNQYKVFTRIDATNWIVS